MIIMTRAIVFTFIMTITVLHAATAGEIRDYSVIFSKTNQDAANLHVSCTFSLDFHDADSVAMNFGGGQEFSIDNLDINGNRFEYEYNREAKRIVFRRTAERTVRVTMEYDYTNLSAFFIYGEGDAELWETSFGEYFYPYVPNTYMDVAIRTEAPDSLSVLCSYPLKTDGYTKCNGILQNILAQSITLAFIRNEAYRRTSAHLPDEISIYQIKGMECSEERYEELLELTKASIDFFSNVYGEDYISEERGVTSYPTFLFHNGKGFSNRYNIGFISASQEKFSTYPDIYPLVHEIGHRWLGEWTLLVDDGQPGAYFIKESLNEFMTLMFIRHYYGSQTYDRLLDMYMSEYSKIKGMPQDRAIVDVTVNNNNTVVYRKGPLALDRIAKEIGYDELMEIISGFYRGHAGKYPLKYADFINHVNESSAGIGDKLDSLLKDESS